jgi:hypothetical protein
METVARAPIEAHIQFLGIAAGASAWLVFVRVSDHQTR